MLKSYGGGVGWVVAHVIIVSAQVLLLLLPTVSLVFFFFSDFVRLWLILGRLLSVERAWFMLAKSQRTVTDVNYS